MNGSRRKGRDVARMDKYGTVESLWHAVDNDKTDFLLSLDKVLLQRTTRLDREQWDYCRVCCGEEDLGTCEHLHYNCPVCNR